MVLVRYLRQNKFTSFYESEPYTIISIRSSIKARRDSDGRNIFRQSLHYKMLKAWDQQSMDSDEEDDGETYTHINRTPRVVKMS